MSTFHDRSEAAACRYEAATDRLYMDTIAAWLVSHRLHYHEVMTFSGGPAAPARRVAMNTVCDVLNDGNAFCVESETRRAQFRGSKRFEMGLRRDAVATMRQNGLRAGPIYRRYRARYYLVMHHAIQSRSMRVLRLARQFGVKQNVWDIRNPESFWRNPPLRKLPFLMIAAPFALLSMVHRVVVGIPIDFATGAFFLCCRKEQTIAEAMAPVPPKLSMPKGRVFARYPF